jgi:hypothetical protein
MARSLCLIPCPTLPCRQVVVSATGESGEEEQVLFSAVSCGGMHTAALALDGSIWTWGVNDEGALGRPTAGTCWEGIDDVVKGDASRPGKADVPVTARFTQVTVERGPRKHASRSASACLPDMQATQAGRQAGGRVYQVASVAMNATAIQPCACSSVPLWQRVLSLTSSVGCAAPPGCCR